MRIEPRGWQVDGIGDFKTKASTEEKKFLLEATPGSGKTIFSGLAMRELVNSGVIDLAIIVVPITAIKGDSVAGFKGDWHKIGYELTPVAKEYGPPPKRYNGIVITYSHLVNLIATIETWARNGLRVFAVVDELHHASDKNTWGASVERLYSASSRFLGMTGTLFRGDNARISFVDYNDAGIAVPDFSYGYREAVRDCVCRTVEFMHDDGVAEYILNDDLKNVRISESDDTNNGKVSGAVFDNGSEWLQTTLDKADQQLSQIRTYAPNAGGLIICRPGFSEDDDRHVRKVANMMEHISRQPVTTIFHEDRDANAKIERFRTNSDRWIVAVRKISEGVDIKRLRVLVLASSVTTELLFRQVVGRVVRQESKENIESATVFMAKFPRMVEWAATIMEEAKEGIKLPKTRPDGVGAGQGGEEYNYSPLGSSHENGGTVSCFDEHFSADEIDIAEGFRHGDAVLTSLPISTVAHFLRKRERTNIEYVQPEKPLDEQMKDRRRVLTGFGKKGSSGLITKWTGKMVGNNPSPDDWKDANRKAWSKIKAHHGYSCINDVMQDARPEKADALIEWVKQEMTK